MRHTEPSSRSELRARPSPLSARRLRFRVIPRVRAWGWPIALGALAAATSLAVAFFASIWLVPLYVALLGLILGVPSTATVRAGVKRLRGFGKVWSTARNRWFVNRPWIDLISSKRPAQPRPEMVIDSGAAVSATADTSDSGADPDSEVESDPPSSSSLAKARRVRGRVRKVKPAAVDETTGATWVRVGPGKFVRADARMAVPGESDAVPYEMSQELSTPWPGGQGWSAEEGDGLGETSCPGEVAEERLENVGESSLAPVALGELADGDHGIAPEAPPVAPPSDDPVEAPAPPDEPEAVDRVPDPAAEPILAAATDESAAELDDPSNSASAPVLRVFPAGLDREAGSAHPRPWRAVEARYGRTSRFLRGVRPPSRRYTRSAGRFAHADRMHPPRSPPRWRLGGAWGEDFSFG